MLLKGLKFIVIIAIKGVYKATILRVVGDHVCMVTHIARVWINRVSCQSGTW